MLDVDTYLICKICRKEIKEKNLRKHMRKVHNINYEQEGKVASITKKKTKVPLSKSSNQGLFSRINQGLYDNKDSLLNLIKNAKRMGEQDILKAAQQRLRKIFPALYRRHVGPLNLRSPLGSKNCYCAIPASIDNIAHDIMNFTLPKEALQCDFCWDIDITYTWGVYGQWGAKRIDTPTWKVVCGLRGGTKYATA